jgi:hypothetical protein
LLPWLTQFMYGSPMVSKFKDPQNRWVTIAVFKETATENKEYVCMTLEEGRQRFIDCADPLGIVFADTYLGGYQHWKAISNSAKLRPIIQEWEEELEIRIRSEELKRIQTIAEGGHFQASKLLMDRGWIKRAAGKPSKDEVARETRVQAKMSDEWKADVVRIKRD